MLAAQQGSVLPSTPAAATGGSTGGSPGEQILEVFRDGFGREMERVLVTRVVPVQEYQRKELKESRVVQEWIQESRPLTQYHYTPTTQYQLQTKVVGRWNPFTQPRVVQEYVPVTNYQAVPQTSNAMMTVPKYTTKEFVRPVWELVQTNKTVQHQIIRPKSSSASSIPSNLHRANVAQLSAQQSMSQRTPTPYPITPIAPYDPSGRHSPSIPLGAVAARPIINPGQWFRGGATTTSSWNGTEPIFKTSWLQSTRTNGSAMTTPSWNSYAGTPSSGWMRPSTLNPNGNRNLPQTAAIPGYGSFRDPMQTGLPPSELR